MNFKKEMVRVGISLLLVFSLAIGYCYAQRLTGKITGEVTDDEGAPLPGVTVETSSPALMGGVQAQVTSEKGVYRFIKLPPGDYKLVFKLEGFKTIEILGIKIFVDTTFTNNVIMNPGTIEESVTVVAKIPTIDVTTAKTSTHFTTDELEKIPSGRDSWMDVMKQAPGMQMLGSRGVESVALGSNSESSMFQVDGVDVSNPEFGCAWIFFPANIFDEVETHLLSAPAEYGMFSGAVINIVTKSGSNTFKGELSYYGQFDALTDDNNPTPEEEYSFHRDEFYFASFNLGGPIIKDKIWFFASGAKSMDSHSRWRQNPEWPNMIPRTQAFLKFSAQISRKHKLSGYGYFETYSLPRSTWLYVEPESQMKERSDTPSWNIMWTWQMSNDAFFELKYGGHFSWMDCFSELSTLDDPPYYDAVTGITSNGAMWPWTYDVGKHAISANLSYYAEDFLGGDHDFKFGIQYNHGIAENHGGYSGGRMYRNYAGVPRYMYMQDSYFYGGSTDELGVFIDDTWKIADRVSLNLGLRFDYQDGYIHEMPKLDGWKELAEMNPALKNLVNHNVFSPRIGVAIQLTSDQKTLLKAHYGRYNEALMIYNWERPGPNVTDWYWYGWSGTDWVLLDMVEGGMAYHIDSPYYAPYVDLFSIGLERELMPDLSFGASFLYKTHHNLIGWEDRGATYEQVNLVSPDNGQTYAAWNQTSPPGSNDYWITNREDFEQFYIGAIFDINKRYSNNWLLNASVTLGKSEGLIISTHHWLQMGISRTNFGSEPNDLINAKGPLQNDRRLIFKLQAAYSFPWDILASINYIYMTGRPTSTYVRIYPSQGVQRILAEPRNHDNLTDPESLLDLRLQKSFNIYKTVKFDAIFDVFNVFNSDAVIGHYSYSIYSASYMSPSSIPPPRRVQIGFRLSF